MMNKQNVPELRFPEFSGEWEKKRVNKLADINPKTEKIADKFLYIDLDSVKKGRLISEKIIDITKAPSRAQRVLEVGDILFQTVRPYQKNHLLMKEKYGTLQVVSSTGFAQLKTKTLISEQFIYQLVNTNKFSYEVEKRCTGTSYPAINSKDLGQIDIYHPSYEEQEKIGEFFNKLDRLIELEEKKLELLEEQKKGYMQKIFSQELRFKDENGNDYPEWEEKKIGEIASFSKGKDISKSDLTNEGEPCVLYGELYTRYKDVINEVHSKTNLPAQFLKVAYKNSVLIPSSGETPIDIAKATAINVRSVLVGGDINILNPINGYLGTFISMIINGRYKKRLSKFSQGKTVVHLYNNDIKKLKIDLPTYEEQKKISSFLEKFNKLIEIRNSKIEQMKNRKKSLLQKIYLS